MKKWLTSVLTLMLLVATVPLVTVQAEGHGKGPGNGWGDHGDHGKGKPGKEKPERAKKMKASGLVSSMDTTAGTLTIDLKGTAIELKSDNNTKIEVSGWKRPAFSDIWVGDKANVEYIVQDTENVAKSIKISKQKGSVTGKLEAIDAESKTITVSGKTIQLSETTVISAGKQKLQLTDLVEGDQISVFGYLKQDVLLPVAVMVKRDVASVKGAITSVDATKNSLVVGKTTILVTEKTIISLNGEQAELSALQAGDKIFVTGVKQNDQITASLVAAQRQAVEIKGSIESVDATKSTITIVGKEISVTDQTKISAKKKVVTIADLQAGDSVKAQVLKKGDEWVALKIEVLKQNDKNDDENDDQNGDNGDDNNDHHGDGSKGEVEGKIDAVDAAAQTITVRGTTIQLSASTVVEGGHHKKLTIADLLVGIKIEVKGTWQEKVLLASKIEVDQEDEHDDEGEDHDEDHDED